MENATLDLETPVRQVPMTKAQFLAWNPDDDFLYEYRDGFVEPVSGFQRGERFLVYNLLKKFEETATSKAEGRLFGKTECWLNDTLMRIPSLAFFTHQQQHDSANEQDPVPMFVIEIISPTDRADKIEQKVLEYFAAGVRVVWHVFPAMRMVRVFTSVKTATTYFEDDPFSAAPAVPDLSLTVGELFAR